MVDVNQVATAQAIAQMLATPAPEAQAVKVIVDQIPARIAAIERILTLTGQLTVDTARQQAVLQTPQGDVTINFNSLPKDYVQQIARNAVAALPDIFKLPADIQIEKQPLGGPLKAVLFTDAFKQAPSATPAQPENPANPASLIGKTIQLTPTQSLPTATQTAQAAPPSGNVEALTGQVKGLVSQIVKLLGNPTPQAALPAATTGAPAQRPLTFVIDQIQTPKPGTPPQADATANLRPNQIAATVTRQLPGGGMQVESNSIAVPLKLDMKLPVGTKLVLHPAEPQTQQALTDLAGGKISDGEWSGLRAALETLASSNPAVAQKLAKLTATQGGQQFGHAILFLVSALRQGDVRGLIGEQAIAALERLGKRQLVQDIARDIQRAVQATADPVVGEWRAYHLPLPHDQNGLTALSLYVHRDPHQHSKSQQQDSGSPDAKQTRFLLDVSLTRLGDMQFDGFVKPKALDLVLRSEHLLTPELQHDLREIYISSLSAIDYSGHITFQAGRQHWIKMLQAQQAANYQA